DRSKASRRALDLDIEAGSAELRVVALRRGELVAKRPERDRQIVGGSRGRAQALDGVPSLPDRMRGLLECGLQPLFRLERLFGEDVCRRRKPKRDAMEALQERVVQLSRDARPLVDPRLESRVELVCQLAHAEVVQGPRERQCRDNQAGAKPGSL